MASKFPKPRKRRYHQVLRTVESNTGGPDDPNQATISEPKIALHLVAHGPHTLAGVKDTIQAALHNVDLVAIYADGERRLARATEACLKAVIAEQNCRGNPDLDVIEQAVVGLGKVNDE